MPPKNKKAGGGGGKDSNKASAGEEKREEPLQAVVFADSFETRFNPFTLSQPRCLLPLVNTPLLEYTCEFLASAGVEEVFLYCGNHTDAVEEYLKNSKWMRASSPFTLEVIRSDSRSVGDAMRDLDQKQLIVGDFLCVYGDVVASAAAAVGAALAAHRARRERDKKAIMTMLLREAGSGAHRTKARSGSGGGSGGGGITGVRPTFVLDPAAQRCVHYEQVRGGGDGAAPPRVELAAEILKDHAEVEVRDDLIDCGIDICTPEVLAQYTDNFDWQLPRKGFLFGVLKDYETNQLTIHTHIATEGYAARVKNLRAYDAISKDVVARWTYPLCPDANLVADQSFQLLKGNVYREDGVVLARSSVVKRQVVLGRGTTVGDGSSIANSVIGRRCVIGKRVKINGAYIWDDARIGDGTTIDTAVVANGVTIGKQCTIERGALISYGVKIADGTLVPRDRRISSLKRKRGYDTDEIVTAPSDPKIVGEGGTGYQLELDEDEEDDVEVLLTGVQQLDLIDDEDAISQLDSDEEEEVEEHHRRGSQRAESFASIGSEESADARHRASDFHHEAVASIFDALQKKEDPDTMQLELRALTLSSNAEGKQVRRSVAVAYTKRIASLVEAGQTPKDAVAEVIPPNKLLISANVREEDEQAEFLLFLQTDLVHRPQGDKILLFASNALATNDLVEAEGFEAWWNDARSSATPDLEAIRKDTKQLVDVLVGDDEEDSDDEEDEDEDDDGDDDE